MAGRVGEVEGEWVRLSKALEVEDRQREALEDWEMLALGLGEAEEVEEGEALTLGLRVALPSRLAV